MSDFLVKNSDEKKNSVCYIVGAGVLGESVFAFKNRGLLIAADGGYKRLKELGLIPDFLVGDFDSLENVPEDVPSEKYSKEKDQTDMMIAINKGFDLGYNSFVIYGGLGGRLDHSMANIQLLNYISKKRSRGHLILGESIITVITDDKYKIKAQDKGYLSVFSLGESAKGVTLAGLRYGVKDAELNNHYPIGVSNEFMGEDVSIEVKVGSLMILWNSKNPEESLFTDSI
jgi:thiamine pyrophosphokinase